ncbi:hypothetical protein HAX54_046467 [Datura stramonium]|uniref:Uncharacterized protein n=1 Tax=Datura stramonium TaxID=4076 RepID=A0ABS8WKU0_DATST|nr:hypothetical protein [Datura stramonium]
MSDTHWNWFALSSTFPRNAEFCWIGSAQQSELIASGVTGNYWPCTHRKEGEVCAVMLLIGAFPFLIHLDVDMMLQTKVILAKHRLKVDTEPQSADESAGRNQ